MTYSGSRFCPAPDAPHIVVLLGEIKDWRGRDQQRAAPIARKPLVGFSSRRTSGWCLALTILPKYAVRYGLRTVSSGGRSPALTPTQSPTCQSHPSRPTRLMPHHLGTLSFESQGSTPWTTMVARWRSRKGASGWSLKVAWRSGEATVNVAPEGCLRAEGWLVFIEEPERIWIYDGRDNGTLLTRSDTRIKVSALDRAVMSSWPKEFLDALPRSFGEKSTQAEVGTPSTKGQAIRSETNQNPNSAFSNPATLPP